MRSTVRVDALRGEQAQSIGFHPRLHPRDIPGDVTVAQQGDQVIGDGAAHGILEIDDGRIHQQPIGRGGFGRLDAEQIAAVEIPMHEGARLLLGGGREECERRVDDGLLDRARLETQVALQKPDWQQVHFIQQALAVVSGQAVDRCRALHPQQGLHGLRVKRLDAGVGQLRQQGARAKVLHQHETLALVERKYLRRVQTRVAQARSDVQPRAEVFLARRRIHEDATGMAIGSGAYPPIAAETGIFRGARDANRRCAERVAGEGLARVAALKVDCCAASLLRHARSRMRDGADCRAHARCQPVAAACKRADAGVQTRELNGLRSNSTISVLNGGRMLRVSKLTDYATLVMTCLAGAHDEVLSAQLLAERARLEVPTVSKVLKQLAAAGLVDSWRGASGGYRLARSASEITLADVVTAMEGPIGMTECYAHAGQCDLESHCGVRANWQKVSDVIRDALESVSLADMLAPAPKRRSPTSPPTACRPVSMRMSCVGSPGARVSRNG
jgi:FeS assembly SUF system regulator